MITLDEAKEVLANEYHIDNFTYLVQDILLTNFVKDVHKVTYNGSLFSKVTQLGFSDACGVGVFEVILEEGSHNRRVAITQEMFKILRGLHVNNALVAFANADKQNYRISLLTSQYEFEGDKIIKVLSNPRRYSYALGVGTKTKTAYKFLIEKGRVQNLDELIGRFSVEVVNKQFYSEIATSFTELVGGERDGKTYDKLLNIQSVLDHNKYAEFGVRLIGRIMFCWFLREKRSSKGIALVPDDMLSLDTINNSTNYYHDVLEPLFFELLNTNHRKRKKCFRTDYYEKIPYLNGGLFSPHVDDYYKFDDVNDSGRYGIISIPNKWFVKLYQTLGQYNFTVDENTAYDIELSIDPEMLGRIFENLLAEINPETGENAKKSTGSFYTPRDIVDYMVDSSIKEYLKSKTGIDDARLSALISYSKEDDEIAVFDIKEKKRLINALYSITVLDPACGSGAFPIGMLQKIVYILQELDPDANLWFDKATEHVGMLLKKEFEKKFNAGSLNYIRKLSVIQNSVYGIDIQPIAVEISRLRCFLSLIIEESVDDSEENRGINPLPNLDFKFITANTLVKLDESEQISLFEDLDHIEALKQIRDEYFNAESDRRVELKSEFLGIQQDMLINTVLNYSKQASLKYQQLSEWKPFENKATEWFDPEWMFGVDEGFDIVIGNPPYIQLQKATSESSKVKYGDLYEKFGYETFAKTGDIYCLFYEKGYQLLKPNGILTFITSNKWMRAGYGEKLRGFFATKTNPLILLDFGGVKVFDSATVDVNILVLKKENNKGQTIACTANQNCKNNLSDFVERLGNLNNFNSSDIWVVLNTIESSIQSKIRKYGKPLKDFNISINFGIKTGLNDAFIIDNNTKEALIHEDSKSADIIRPILRGRDVERYGYSFDGLYLLYIPWHFPLHDDDSIQGASKKAEKLFEEQYPAVYKHLLSYKSSLEKRNTEETGIRYEWYALQRWGAKYKDDFSKPKIVWSRLTRISKDNFNDFPRFALVDKDMIVLDSLCFFVGEHLENLIKILNSKYAAYYFFNNVAILDNGGLQMRQQFVENIPIPIVNLENESDDNNIDNTIFYAFNFTDEEKAYIYNFLNNKKNEIMQ